MENMEKLTWRIWESPGMGKALLIGGLLFYIPVINLLLLGYLGVWVQQLVGRKGMSLPEWREGQRIVQAFIRVIIPFAVWVLLPWALAGLLVWALAGLLLFLHLQLFAGTLAWIPLALAAILSPPAFMLSLIRLYRNNNLRDALAVPEIIQELLQKLRGCLFPLFQFYGICAVGWPLLGFAVFLASLPLSAQLLIVLRRTHDDLKSDEF